MRAVALRASLLVVFLGGGCTPSSQTFVVPVPSLERMQQQPRADFLDESSFFANGAVAQPPPAGTQPHRDESAAFGVTRANLERGRALFDIYCAACHGVDGHADTPVAAHMELVRPRDLHIDRLRAAGADRIRDAVVRGYGLMPSYAWALDDDDALAVAHYVKALQLSRHAVLADLPAPLRARALLPAPSHPSASTQLATLAPATSTTPSTTTRASIADAGDAPGAAVAPMPSHAPSLRPSWQAALAAAFTFALALGSGAAFFLLLADLVRASWLERMRPSFVRWRAAAYALPIASALVIKDDGVARTLTAMASAILLALVAWASGRRKGEGAAALAMTALVVVASVATYATLAPFPSTIFAALVLAGGATSALAVATLSDDAGADGATMLFSFVMVFGYFAFSQLLIVYVADLPREVGWYLARTVAPWSAVAAATAFLGVAVPLSAFLFGAAKRSRRARVVVAACVLVAQALYAVWVAVPR